MEIYYRRAKGKKKTHPISLKPQIIQSGFRNAIAYVVLLLCFHLKEISNCYGLLLLPAENKFDYKKDFKKLEAQSVLSSSEFKKLKKKKKTAATISLRGNLFLPACRVSPIISQTSARNTVQISFPEIIAGRRNEISCGVLFHRTEKWKHSTKVQETFQNSQKEIANIQRNFLQTGTKTCAST